MSTPSATSASEPGFVQIRHPHEITEDLQRAAVACWREVSDAGGAAGFPFPPVDPQEVGAAAEAIVAGLSPARSRLLVATVRGSLAGWLNIRRDPHPLVSHWGTLHHVQTRPEVRGHGVGAALMHRARTVAREEMGLEQLHLAARGGAGLEEFYGRLGYREIGRRPGAYRLAPDDNRDEVLMALSPL